MLLLQLLKFKRSSKCTGYDLFFSEYFEGIVCRTFRYLDVIKKS